MRSKTAAKSNLSVVIPAFNEERTILEVLRKVLAQGVVSQVIIINDGSKDQSKKILQAVKHPKVFIKHHPRNLGKGAAIKTGLKLVRGKFVIIQDADLEYNPLFFPKLLARARVNRAVYGSRLIRKNPLAYPHTLWGNQLLTKLCNLLFQTKLTDSYTGYKLLSTSVAQRLNLASPGFEIEAEISAKLAKMKIPILEVPITYQPRKYSQGKKIKFKDFLLGLKKLIQLKFTPQNNSFRHSPERNQF